MTKKLTLAEVEAMTPAEQLAWLERNMRERIDETLRSHGAGPVGRAWTTSALAAYDAETRQIIGELADELRERAEYRRDRMPLGVADLVEPDPAETAAHVLSTNFLKGPTIAAPGPDDFDFSDDELADPRDSWANALSGIVPELSIERIEAANAALEQRLYGRPNWFGSPYAGTPISAVLAEMDAPPRSLPGPDGVDRGALRLPAGDCVDVSCGTCPRCRRYTGADQ